MPSMIRLFGLVLCTAALLLATLIAGQPVNDADDTPLPLFVTNTPAAPTRVVQSPFDAQGQLIASLPPSVRLEGLSPVYQQLNRCSAAALTIALSYYEEWDGDYTRTINGLNTYGEDVAVRLDEMVRFVEAEGLAAVERTGGTVDLLRVLVANGFPVLVENSYYEGSGGFDDWMGHNRVVMGYDDDAQSFLVFDSLLGNGPDNTGRPVEYTDLDEKWRAFNRGYVVVYRPADEAFLMALLGNQADRIGNWEHTLAVADDETAERGDGFAHFNRGTALTALARYDEAAAAFDEAFAVGLPWRMLWYQYSPLEAYYQTGRYDDVLRLMQDVRRNTGGVEEVFYYAGLAYEAQGRIDDARDFYRVALARNAYYTAPAEALARLDAGG